jgi:hypothetical protein
MLSGIQGGCRERNMSLIGTGNYHQVHASVLSYVFRFVRTCACGKLFRTSSGWQLPGVSSRPGATGSEVHEKSCPQTKADKGYAHGVSSFGHEGYRRKVSIVCADRRDGKTKRPLSIGARISQFCFL